MLKFKYFLVSAFEGPCELSELSSASGMLIEYRSQIPYRLNQDCSINFVCPTDQVVVVDVKLFHIHHYYSSCDTYHDDYVSFDGKKECASSPIVSTTKNEMEIKFHSNSQYTADGFKLHLGCKGT